MDMRHMKRCFALMLLAAAPAAAEVMFSGEYRLRPETFTNADFNAAVKDVQSFTGSRLRLTASGLAGEDIAVKVTLQDTRNWGAEGGAASAGIGLTDLGVGGSGEMVDIHEAFVDFQKLGVLPVGLRAGRQELAYGDQRLVGHFGWSNQGRAFDAFKLVYAGQNLSVDAWHAKRKELNVGVVGSTVPSRPTLDSEFSGVYAVLKPALFLTSLDLYALHDRQGDTTDDAANPEPKSVTTLGLRAFLKQGPLDFTVEAPFQYGEDGTVMFVNGSSVPVKVAASALAVKAGWTIPGSQEIRIGAEYDYASGDSNSKDDKNETFQNLYPTNHAPYGQMDYQGWRNLSSYTFNVSLKPTRRTWVQLEYWDFALAEKKDGWYNAAGAATGPLRARAATNTEQHVGSELDLILRFAQSRTVAWEAGVGTFASGDFLEKRGFEGDSNWAYLMSTIKF